MTHKLGLLFLVALSSSALAQRYECRTPGGNIVEQYGTPCAPGMEGRRPAQEAATRKAQELDARREQKARDLQAAAARREVMIGMTPEQVTRAWGNPTRYETHEKPGGKTYTWYWRCLDRSKGSNAVLFRNGLVASIRVSCT